MASPGSAVPTQANDVFKDAVHDVKDVALPSTPKTPAPAEELLALLGGVLCCRHCGFRTEITVRMIEALSFPQNCPKCQEARTMLWVSKHHDGYVEWGHAHTDNCYLREGHIDAHAEIHVSRQELICGQLDTRQIAELERNLARTRCLKCGRQENRHPDLECEHFVAPEVRS